jgi:hypothetical protein
VGLGSKASQILAQAEFENAQLPTIEGVVLEQLDHYELKKIMLSRLANIAYRLAKQGRKRQRKVLLQRSLESTLSDLTKLGLEKVAKKVVRRATAKARSERQRQRLAQKQRP